MTHVRKCVNTTQPAACRHITEREKQKYHVLFNSMAYSVKLVPT